MYEAYLIETMSGNRGPKLSLTKSGSWDQPINNSSSASITVSLQDLWNIPSMQWTPWVGSIALIQVTSEGAFPLVMGPILDDPDINLRDKTATFSVGGFEDILQYRVATNQDYGPGDHEALAKSVASFTNRSLGNIVWGLVELAQKRPAGMLPVVYRGVWETVDRQRNYEGFNLSNNDIAKRIKEITEVINGPDVLFCPEWADDKQDRIQWACHTGTEGQVTLPQNQQYTFDVSAPGGQVAALGVKTSYTPLWRAYGTGAGEGAGTLVRVAQSDAWTGPLLEQVWSDNQINNPDLLEEKIKALIDTPRLIQFTLEVDSEYPPLHLWKPGEVHQVVWPSNLHPLVPAGTYNTVLISRSGSLTERSCRVEFQAVEKKVK